MSLTIILLIFLVLLLDTLFFPPERKQVVGDVFFKKPIPKNKNFIEPCYVYNDGVETKELRHKIPIIGYRIAPDLVIHDMSCKKRTDDFFEAASFAENFGGKLLNQEDVAILKDRLVELNDLRKKIKEPRILEGYFWIEDKTKTSLIDIPEDDVYFQIFYNINNPAIILKR